MANEPAPRSKFTTFSFLDLGGAFSEAQLQRLFASLLWLWSRLFRGRSE